MKAESLHSKDRNPERERRMGLWRCNGVNKDNNGTCIITCKKETEHVVRYLNKVENI